jgi:hypothetical protein
MNRNWISALAITAVTAAAPACAFDQLDDLKNVCDYTATPQEAKLINATALLVRQESVSYNASDNTYSIGTQAFVNLPAIEGGNPVCTGSRFYGETSTPAGRTGVLIAPNLILSAAHVESIDPHNWYVIFRDSQTTAGVGGCSNFTWSHIPAKDVYRPPLNSVVANLYTDAAPDKSDYLVFQLDRNVSDRQPVKIRRSGAPRVGDIVVSPGYPYRTSEKISTAGVFTGVAQAGGPFYPGSYVYENHLNGFDGSSGSAVFDIEDETVDAVVRFDDTVGPEISPDGTCAYAADRGVPSAVNGPIVDIESSIPRYEIGLKPLDLVNHVSSLGGGTDKPNTTYTLSPATSGGNLVLINSISGPPGVPGSTPGVALSVAPGIYTVPAGGMTFDFQATTVGLTQCGRWDYELNVYDISHDQNNYIRHHFEVGLVEVSATPEDVWSVEDFGPTYSQTRTYTVKNVRPSPTTVQVAAGGELPSNVLTINGTTGVKLVSLGAAGSPTDTATVTVGIASSAINAVTSPNTDYNLFVMFSQTNFACAAGPGLERDIVFRRNERQVSTTTSVLLSDPAPGQLFGPAARYDFDLTNAPSYCVTDINLDIGMPTGVAAGPSVEAGDIQITVTAPGGRTGVVWNRNAFPGGAYGITDTVSGVTMPMLHLDDEVSPPLGPVHFNYFDGVGVAGHWYVDVRKGNGGHIDIIGPNRIDISANTCP